MRIPDAQREPGAVHSLIEFHNAEHLHTVSRYCILIADNRDVAESEGFDKAVNHFNMRYWPVGCCAVRSWYQGHLFTGQSFIVCDERRFTHCVKTSCVWDSIPGTEPIRTAVSEVYEPRVV